MGLFQFLGSFATRQRRCREDDTVQGCLWQFAQIVFLQEHMHSAFGISVHLVMH